MEYALLGWADDGPTLRLDHERFAYAGTFVMSATGKAVARADGDVLAAAAFDADHTDRSTLVIRYVTVRADRRGEGIGPRLLAFVRERARENGFERVRINVNNVYSYVAALKAGFGFTGEETGVAELCMVWPADRTAHYEAGLSLFEKRDVTDEERQFLAERPPEPPGTVDPP